MLELKNFGSRDNERAILGILIELSDLMEEYILSLKKSDFSETDMSIVFSEIQNLHSKNIPIDLVTLTTALSDKGLLSSIGGAEFIAELVSDCNPGSNIKNYVENLKKSAFMNDVQNLILELSDAKNKELVMSLVTKFIDKESRSNLSGFIDMKSAFVDTIDRYEAVASGEIKPIIAKNFQYFNQKYWLEPGDFLVIGGRPGGGKTLIAFELCQNFAACGTKCLYLSLEMSSVHLMQRLLSFRATVDSENVMRGKLTREEYKRIIDRGMEIEKLPIFIDQQPNITISQLRSKIASASVKGCKVVFIDHVHIIDTEDQEFKYFFPCLSRMLMAAAKEYGVLIIALVQLNRASESSERAKMSDIREGGSIEQDATRVAIIKHEHIGNNQMVLTLQTVKNRFGTFSDVRFIVDFHQGKIIEDLPHGEFMKTWHDKQD